MRRNALVFLFAYFFFLLFLNTAYAGDEASVEMFSRSSIGRRRNWI